MNKIELKGKKKKPYSFLNVVPVLWKGGYTKAEKKTRVRVSIV